MKIVNTYSFKNGEKFIAERHKRELDDVIHAIKHTNGLSCLTKESKEKTKKNELLVSPTAINTFIKLELHKRGWTQKSSGGKKIFKEPRHYFGKNEFREMDGIKNKVGLEIQFGKYSFMGYDIFSKMIIFKNLNHIECGIEIVAGRELVKEMSSGVSYFEQLLVDIQNRGVSNLDIPVLIIGIGFTDNEKIRTQELQDLFKSNKKEAIKRVHLRKYNGSLPGPK